MANHKAVFVIEILIKDCIQSVDHIGIILEIHSDQDRQF